MREGRLDPQKVKIEGIDTEEEIAEKEVSSVTCSSNIVYKLRCCCSDNDRFVCKSSSASRRSSLCPVSSRSDGGGGREWI
jgi:hypothetical protein